MIAVTFPHIPPRSYRDHEARPSRSRSCLCPGQDLTAVAWRVQAWDCAGSTAARPDRADRAARTAAAAADRIARVPAAADLAGRIAGPVRVGRIAAARVRHTAAGRAPVAARIADQAVVARAGHRAAGPDRAARTAAARTGAGRTGAGRTGAGRTGAGRTGAGRTGAHRTAAARTVADRTGAHRTAAARTGAAPYGVGA